MQIFQTKINVQNRRALAVGLAVLVFVFASMHRRWKDANMSTMLTEMINDVPAQSLHSPDPDGLIPGKRRALTKNYEQMVTEQLERLKKREKFDFSSWDTSHKNLSSTFRATLRAVPSNLDCYPSQKALFNDYEDGKEFMEAGDVELVVPVDQKEMWEFLRDLPKYLDKNMQREADFKKLVEYVDKELSKSSDEEEQRAKQDEKQDGDEGKRDDEKPPQHIDGEERHSISEVGRKDEKPTLQGDALRIHGGRRRLPGRMHDHEERKVAEAQKHFDNYVRHARRHLLEFKNEPENKSSDSDSPYVDLNGVESDLYFKNTGAYSTGPDDLFWSVRHRCAQRKGCRPNRMFHLLHKSDLGCHEIKKMLDPVRECVKEKKEDCELFFDAGYFRYVFLSETSDDVPVVIKMLKPYKMKEPRDMLRHLREGIFLQYMSIFEKAELKKSGVEKFKSNGVDRAFHYVPELGHCLYPAYVTVSPFYNMSLAKFVFSGRIADESLRHVVKIALDVSKGVELMHNIPGGGYQHTDIQPRQFMIDKEGNVLINDFNRGKFGTFFYQEDFTNFNAPPGMPKIFPCDYCGPRSRGHWRAPEELMSEPLNGKLDVFSAGMTIWSLFAGIKPYEHFNFHNVKMIRARRDFEVGMPDNMPPMIKDIVRRCLSHDPRFRPTATELRQTLEKIFEDLDDYSENKAHLPIGQLDDERQFREMNEPE